MIYPSIWFSGVILLCAACSPLRQSAPAPEAFITCADQSRTRAPERLGWAPSVEPSIPVLSIDPEKKFQTVEGFGYTLTGGSAVLLHRMAAAERKKILDELFGRGPGAVQVSYLRISIGASDLDEVVFSYNDLLPGETDFDLRQFSLSRDTLHLLPVLNEILQIRPDIKIMATPWSPPTWMKTNGKSMGGSLKPECYEAYARYFVKYIQSMATRGVRIDAVTPQNEPHHGGNNPSMLMTAEEQARWIKNYLGPAFRNAGLAVKIIAWDHNCDRPDYPISVLNDAGSFVHGSAFHLYAGDVQALSTVYKAHPDKALYFTEQWTGVKSDYAGDLMWHLKNVVIGTMRNWSRTALEWNLAADPRPGPFTPGGCNECLGALTIDGSAVRRNVSYDIIAQIAPFVPPGSIRIDSPDREDLPNVAFIRPDGKAVLIVLNDGDRPVSFYVGIGKRHTLVNLSAKSAATIVVGN